MSAYLASIKTIAHFSTSGLSPQEIELRNKHAARVKNAQQRSNARGQAIKAADNNRPGILRVEAQARLKNRAPMSGTQRFMRRAGADVKSTFRGVGLKSGWNRAGRQGKGLLGKTFGAVKGLGVPFMKGGTYTGKALVAGAGLASAAGAYAGYKSLTNPRRKY